MLSIQKQGRSIIEIKKSKFIGLSYFVSNKNDVDEIIDSIKEEYKDATHCCFAYVLRGVEKCSDDGEPSGTAGRPILNVIKNKKLFNVLVCCVRYFGGEKLGAGGLVRAYTKSATSSLDNAEICELNEMCKVKFKININDAFNVYSLSKKFNFNIVSNENGDFLLTCKAEDITMLENLLLNLNVSDIEWEEIYG